MADAPSRYEISRPSVVALSAGTGGPDEVELLKSTEAIWRRGVFWLLVDTVRRTKLPHGPLAPLDDAVELLERVRQKAPEEVGVILAHPVAGIWAMHTLRVLRGTSTDPRPRWALLGYLHALTASAAIRVAEGFRLRLEVSDGVVVLPTLGHVVLPAPAPEIAEAAFDAGRFTLTAGGAAVAFVLSPNGEPAEITTSGGAQWVSLRRLTAGDLTISLDDSDPYRSLRSPRPPNRLPDEAAAHWQQCLADAYALLADLMPDRSAGLAAGLRSIIPLPRAERFRPLSASADDAFGAVQISEPNSVAELAVGLVHEFQHNKLGALMHALDMFENSSGALFYAPWRDDPRPLRGVLQGVYAFVGIVEFWELFRWRASGAQEELAQFEFAYWRHQVKRALDILRRATDITLTEHGEGLVSRLTATIDRLSAEDVDAQLTDLARTAADDHHAQWRAYHVRPRMEHVELFAKAWLNQEPRPALPIDGDGTVVDDTSGRWLDARSVLVRMQLTDSDELAGLLRDADALRQACAGATVTDALLVQGDYGTAEAGYLSRLIEEPADAWAWTGLRLTRAGRRPPRPEDALHDRPELVRAVQAECVRLGAPADPGKLADWFAR